MFQTAPCLAPGLDMMVEPARICSRPVCGSRALGSHSRLCYSDETCYLMHRIQLPQPSTPRVTLGLAAAHQLPKWSTLGAALGSVAMWRAPEAALASEWLSGTVPVIATLKVGSGS